MFVDSANRSRLSDIWSKLGSIKDAAGPMKMLKIVKPFTTLPNYSLIFTR